MRFVFWISATLLAYTYLGYPIWIWLRSRVAARPWMQQEIHPTISIIMAVHNGATMLRGKIEHLLSLDYPEDLREIIVVSDGSTDGTNEILEDMNYPRVRTFVSPEHRGKAAALNIGMREAKGEVLVFVDIRPALEGKALQYLVSNFADPNVGCAAGELSLRYDAHDAGTKAVGGLYWRYEQWIRDCEAKVDSPLGVYGGFYAIRKALAVELPVGTILDDMYEPLAIIRSGHRSVLDSRAKVWDMWPSTSAGEFHRKVRTLAGNFQLFALAPWLLSSKNRLRTQLVSHKLSRLVAPLLLVCVFGSSAFLQASRFFLALLITQICFYALGATGLAVRSGVVRRVAGPASAFCMLNAAVVVGAWKFAVYRKELWKIWVKEAPRVPTEIVGKATI